MKSVVELVIHVPQSRLAELYMDPRENPGWMEEVDRIEAVRGEPGKPGSTYRMVPKDRKNDVLVATVVERGPERLNLHLDGRNVTVAVDSKLVAVSATATKLVSEETFSFKGLLATVLGVFSHSAIKRAHRGHMLELKRFAEARA